MTGPREQAAVRAGNGQSRVRPRSPEARSGHAFRRSGAVLLLIAMSGAFWNIILVTLPVASLTVGRALIIGAATLLVLDLRRASRPLPGVARAVWLLLGVLALLWTWTVVSTLLWGCRCAGEVAGLSELMAVIVVAAVAAALQPQLAPLLVLAVIGGAMFSALLTVAGVDGLSPGALSPVPDLDRLAGPYGNPNYLAFALGPAIPAGIALLWACGGRQRALLALMLAVMTVVLALTFSRGGLLAAATGAVLVLVLAFPRGSRAQLRTLGLVTAVGIAAVFVYPVFVEQRRDANSPDLFAQLGAQDRSGWDGRTQGLIPGAPTQMRNPSPEVLEVRADGPGRGISRALPDARVGDGYELRLEARAVAGTQPLRLGMEDNLRGNGPVSAGVTLTTSWRRLQLRWRPAALSPWARFYVWAPRAGPGFQVRDVSAVIRGAGDPPAAPTPVSTRLRGNRLGELSAQQAQRDARDVRSRRVGALLALEAFGTQPLRGIGWGSFPAYSTAHSEFQGLPTHNEYLRFLAELGLVGSALLAAVALIIASALWRRRLDLIGRALLGMLATGGLGLVFVNGLAAPAVSVPLGLAAALACARMGWREPLFADEASAWWPPGARARLYAVCALGAVLVKRLSAEALRPAPLAMAPPAQELARRLAALMAAAPAPAPGGWGTWLRQADRQLQRVAVATTQTMRARCGRMPGIVQVAGRRLGPRAWWSIAIVGVALVVRLPLMFLRHEILPGGDSQQYVQLANSFFDQGASSVLRPPGYPLFLAVSDVLPGRLEDDAVIMQLLLGSTLCAAVVFVTWPLFGRLAAVTAGLLLALTRPSLSIESVLLSDFLFGALITASAGLLAMAALDAERRRRRLLGLGATIALAVYVKPVGHALVLAPLLPLALATRSLRATCAGTGIVIAVVVLLTVPWMLRNELRYGSFSMSAQSGVTLFNRVFERDKLEIPTDLRVGRIASEVQRSDPDQRLSASVPRELYKRGATVPEAEREMRAVAIEAIRRSPGQFIAGTVRSVRETFTDVSLGADGGGLTQVMDGRQLPTVTRLGLALSQPLRALWLLCALAGLAALLWFASGNRRTRIAAAAALAVWMAIAAATAVLHGGQFRYAASLAPLSFLLGAAGISVAVKLLLAVVRAGAGRPTLRDLVRAAASPTEAAQADARVPSRAA